MKHFDFILGAFFGISIGIIFGAVLFGCSDSTPNAPIGYADSGVDTGIQGDPCPMDVSDRSGVVVVEEKSCWFICRRDAALSDDAEFAYGVPCGAITGLRAIVKYSVVEEEHEVEYWWESRNLSVPSGTACRYTTMLCDSNTGELVP